MKIKDIKHIQGSIGVAPTSPTSNALCIYYRKSGEARFKKKETVAFLINHFGREDFDAYHKIIHFINPKMNREPVYDRIYKYWKHKAEAWLNEVRGAKAEGWTVEIEGYTFTYLPKTI